MTELAVADSDVAPVCGLSFSTAEVQTGSEQCSGYCHRRLGISPDATFPVVYCPERECVAATERRLPPLRKLGTGGAGCAASAAGYETTQSFGPPGAGAVMPRRSKGSGKAWKRGMRMVEAGSGKGRNRSGGCGQRCRARVGLLFLSRTPENREGEEGKRCELHH